MAPIFGLSALDVGRRMFFLAALQAYLRARGRAARHYFVKSVPEPVMQCHWPLRSIQVSTQA